MSTTALRAARETSRWEAQRSFDELGRPLRDLTFCVVDLETTGGSAAAGSMITEIGAVKVRGGEVLGEFATLVDPRTDIPAFIAVTISAACCAAGLPGRGRGRSEEPTAPATRTVLPAPPVSTPVSASATGTEE